MPNLATPQRRAGASGGEGAVPKEATELLALLRREAEATSSETAKLWDQVFAVVPRGTKEFSEALALLGRIERQRIEGPLIEDLIRMQGAVEDFGLSAEQVLIRDLSRAFGESHAIVRTAQQAFDALSAKQIAKEVQDVTASLREQADTFGMTAEEVAIYKLSLKKGVDLSSLEQARDALADLQSKRARESAETWFDGIKSPFGRINDDVAQLQKWLNEGVISLEEYRHGLAALREQAEDLAPAKDQAKSIDARLSSFVRAGSADAVRMQFAASSMRSGTEEVPRKQLAKQEEMARSLRSIERAFQQIEAG
jgi:hypothetical protein